MNKTTLISVFIATALIVGAILLVPSKDNPTKTNDQPTADNVTIENGKQIIEIAARGGYFPRATVAKSGIPTVIRMKTNGTFDCSSALVIPKISYEGRLPQKGTIDIPLDSQKPGAEITGLCVMGMYNFTIRFE